MELEYIKKSATSHRLILIFTGWSCTPELYKHLEYPGWDIAVAYHFSSLYIGMELPEQYKTIYLFAWSLGVYAAAAVVDSRRITSAFALNGTLTPVDDNYGIPEKIYHGTAENLSEVTLKKFKLRMAGDKSASNRLAESSIYDSTIPELAAELKEIADDSKIRRLNDLPWKMIFISSKDRIFPPDNMHRAWKGIISRENIIEINGNHYENIEKIISTVIPDYNKIGKRFKSSATTYDDNAIVQKKMGATLVQMLRNKGINVMKRILEVGPGTGMFTRQYLPLLSDASIDFIDITEIPESVSHYSKNVIKADAEEWIVTAADNSYDAIVSSAAVQWFTNLPLFIRECKRVIKEGGLIGFSTFLEGNLTELDTIRPVPLQYHKYEEILSLMAHEFDSIEMRTDDYVLNFRSGMDIMRHLRNTGVGGSVQTKMNLYGIRNLRKLTYKAAFFTGICHKTH